MFCVPNIDTKNQYSMNRSMLETLSQDKMITSCYKIRLQKAFLLIAAFLFINITAFAQSEPISINVKEKPFKSVLKEN